MLKAIYNFLSPKKQNLYLEYKTEFRPRWGHGKPPHGQMYKIINANRKEYEQYLESFLKYKEVFEKIKDSKNEKNSSEPTYNNSFLPGLDIIGIYGMIAENKSKQYVEVGSGNSTKVAYKAIKDNNLNTRITSIDPMPRAEINQLADKIVRDRFENLGDVQDILSLEAGDILFIDNSHRVLPNSDAMVFFLEILPQLKKGVIVHIHDIYLPYDYPQFMCDRFYSEQYMLAAFIIANPSRYKTILPNYFISEDKELHGILNPIWNSEGLKGVETHGGSYWLEIA